MGTARSFDDYPPVMDSADLAEMLSYPNIKQVQIIAGRDVFPPGGCPAHGSTGSSETRSSPG